MLQKLVNYIELMLDEGISCRCCLEFAFLRRSTISSSIQGSASFQFFVERTILQVEFRVSLELEEHVSNSPWMRAFA